MFKLRVETTVAYSRTVCVDFQSCNRSVSFPVPDGVKLSEANELAEAIVNVQLGLPVRRFTKMDKLCTDIFGESLADMESVANLGKPKEKRKPPKRKMRWAEEELEDAPY